MPEASHTRLLHVGGRTIHLIGTAHVSQESVKEVRQVISDVVPDTVCVELCEPRYDALTDADRWRKLDIFKVIREGRTLFLLANLAIGAYQRRLGAKLGVIPGAELLEATVAARVNGAAVELVDRKIDITLKRAWARLGWWKKSLMLSGILESMLSREEVSAETIEELKRGQTLADMVEQLARVLPEVKGTLLDERDAYMASRISEAPGETIVAVVGAAHVPGIERLLGTDIDREALDRPPTPGLVARMGPWLVPAVLLALVVWGFASAEPAQVGRSLLAWAITTSVFASLGTIAGGGRVVTVIAAFFSAPLTALHPLISAGMVTGVVEAWLRKPTVEDAERIPDDVQSLMGLYRNPFTRVLVVVVGSTLGTAIGSWIGVTWVVRLLGSGGA